MRMIEPTRRKFLKAGGILIAASGLSAATQLLGKEEEKKDEEASPPEEFKVVDHMAEIEKKLGIYDLLQFTPES